MSNPWQLYDDLIDLVPPGIKVRDAFMGVWAYVHTDVGTGVAMIYTLGPATGTDERDVIGRDLRDVAALVKSWDLRLAALGTAALTAALNTQERIDRYPALEQAGQTSTFALHADRFAGRKVATVGHFADIDRYAEGNDFFVLERNPSGADLPDAACEYELADRDDVFITGSALTNKTLPRLLTLSSHARVVLVGPSAPFAPEVLAGPVAEIGGSIVVDSQHVRRALAFGGGMGAARPGLLQFNRVIKED